MNNNITDGLTSPAPGEVLSGKPAEDETASQHKNPKINKKLPQVAKEFIIRIAATAIAVWIALTFVIGIYICHSDTCYPMVKDGDLCVTLRPQAPGQGDLVVYRHEGEIRFGRVAATAGDSIDIKDGVVWVNGYIALSDPLPDTYDGAAEAGYPLTVPENSVFVLSDNSYDTKDSRLFGAVPLSDCCGKVIFLMRRRGF